MEVEISQAPGQTEVLIFFENNPDKWFTTKEVSEKLSIINRNKTSKFCRKLYNSKYLIKQRKENSIELEYKYGKNKPNI